jgi:hypothetical protein
MNVTIITIIVRGEEEKRASYSNLGQTQVTTGFQNFDISSRARKRCEGLMMMMMMMTARSQWRLHIEDRSIQPEEESSIVMKSKSFHQLIIKIITVIISLSSYIIQRHHTSS